MNETTITFAAATALLTGLLAAHMWQTVRRHLNHANHCIRHATISVDEQAANQAWANRADTVQAALRLTADRLTALTTTDLLTPEYERLLNRITAEVA